MTVLDSGGMSKRDFSLRYANLFGRYAERTDGKARLAEAILQLVAPGPEASLLDLGAGDGRLTRLLAPWFKRVVAVDKNEVFFEQLQTIPNATVAIGQMGALELGHGYDLILASYSLTGVGRHSLGPLVSQVFGALSSRGRFLVCTYADYCAWDCFVEAVSRYLNIPRSGGTTREMAQLAEVGATGVIRASVPTRIWGRDLNELLETLGFFFVEHLEEYTAQARAFYPVLAELLEGEHTPGTNLAVIENIIEVLPISVLTVSSAHSDYSGVVLGPIPQPAGDCASLPNTASPDKYFSARRQLLNPPWSTKRLSLREIRAAGRALGNDPNDLRLFGMGPLKWFALGFRILGRTAVELTRDPQARFVARSVAATLKSQGYCIRDVIDLFVGSGNLLYHVVKELRATRGVGIDTNKNVAELTKRNFLILQILNKLWGLRLESHQKDWSGFPSHLREAATLFIIVPPWGHAFTDRGLDLRETTPPIALVLESLRQQCGNIPAFALIQTHPLMVEESLDVVKENYKIFDTIKTDNPNLADRIDYILLEVH